MKIKLKGIEFGQFKGDIIDVEVDSVGDVILPEHISEATGRHFAFTDEYEVVNDNVIPGGYTLELQAQDVIQLLEILDILPGAVLASATLKVN